MNNILSSQRGGTLCTLPYMLGCRPNARTEQTIASQLTALRSWVAEHGHEVHPDHIYCDEGWSGARLDRPALDRLRDAAHDGTFAMIAVWSPDRLARKYAYQVLLLEEFRRVGCEVIFLQHPLSDDPDISYCSRSKAPSRKTNALC